MGFFWWAKALKATDGHCLNPRIRGMESDTGTGLYKGIYLRAIFLGQYPSEKSPGVAQSSPENFFGNFFRRFFPRKK